MTSSLRPDPLPDHFDLLPDPLLLVIFNYIQDIKTLGRCSLVSKRFHSLVPQVQNVVVRVDCVISDDDPTTSSTSTVKSLRPFSGLYKLLLNGIVKPIQAISQLLGQTRPDGVNNSVTHHSPTQVLKNFNEIKCLKIELPTGELGIEENVLLKWRADFGSTLDNCVILGASSVIRGCDLEGGVCAMANNDDNGSIPESFYTNGGLKLRVVWTISSLIAASARHYLLQQIIAEHKTLDCLVLTDVERQGVLCMDKEQLEELRVKPLSASLASKRTLVPALNMKLWYAPVLELGDGTVLKGATLVAIRPSGEVGRKEVSDGSWVASAFEEPYGTAARMLLKRRTYCLEMNSF